MTSRYMTVTALSFATLVMAFALTTTGQADWPGDPNTTHMAFEHPVRVPASRWRQAAMCSSTAKTRGSAHENSSGSAVRTAVTSSVRTRSSRAYASEASRNVSWSLTTLAKQMSRRFVPGSGVADRGGTSLSTPAAHHE